MDKNSVSHAVYTTCLGNMNEYKHYFAAFLQHPLSSWNLTGEKESEALKSGIRLPLGDLSCEMHMLLLSMLLCSGNKQLWYSMWSKQQHRCGPGHSQLVKVEWHEQSIYRVNPWKLSLAWWLLWGQPNVSKSRRIHSMFTSIFLCWFWVCLNDFLKSLPI
jgi:hypothetical protein